METAAMVALAQLPAAQEAHLAVVTSVAGSTYRRPGATRLWTPEGLAVGVISGGCLEADLGGRTLPTGGRGELVRYDLRGRDDDIWGLAAGCNGAITIWLQHIPGGAPSPYRSAAAWLAGGTAVEVHTLLDGSGQWAIAADGRTAGVPLDPGASPAYVDRRTPAPVFVIYGRGEDAQPLATAARQVGFAVRQLGRGDDVAAICREIRPAAAVVMSHHFPGDQVAVGALLATGPAYLGILGPRERTRRLLAEPWPSCVHAPVGLDIGAEGPEEIALAVVAQAICVLRGAPAGHLRDRTGPIHPPAGVPD